MNQYRIKHTPPYTWEIEVLKVYYKGFLWWRKRIEEYVQCNIDGHPFEDDDLYKALLPRCCHFDTEAAAKRRILQFQSKSVIKKVNYEYELVN